MHVRAMEMRHSRFPVISLLLIIRLHDAFYSVPLFLIVSPIPL